MKHEPKSVSPHHVDHISPYKPRTAVNGNGNEQPKPKKKKKNKNENVLCAIIALMKELDKSGLEFIRLDAKKRIQKLDQREKNREMGIKGDEDDSDY